MEKQIKVILGATRGNEGKTTLARYFCLNCKNPISISLNAECGRSTHIIKRKGDFTFDNCSYSAGSLEGYPTYFPAINPIWPTSLEEQARYFEKFIKKMPTFYINPACKVITPIDRFFELSLNTTVLKSNTEFDYCLKDFFDNDPKKLLESLYNFYKEKLNQSNNPPELKNIKFSDLEEYAHRDGPFGNQMMYGIKHFLMAIEYIKKHFICTTIEEIYDKYDTLIFEGKYGILEKKLANNFYFNQINSFINKELKDKDFNGECTYVIKNTFEEDYNYNEVYQNCKNDFDIENRNKNFNTLSFCFVGENKKNIINNFDIFNKIYYFNTEYAEDGVKIFYKGKKNNKELTNIIVPHNHNSGLPYCLNDTNNHYKKTPILNKLGIYPFREDYPYNEYSGSNIETITTTGNYEHHYEYIMDDFGDTSFLFLLDKNYIIDNTLLKKYYIEYFGLKNFIVGSINQAKNIKDINENVNIYILYDNTMDIEDIKKYTNGIIIKDNENIKIDDLKLGVILPVDKLDDVYFKWNNNCNFFLLAYKKEDSFMTEINAIFERIYKIKDTYDDLFGDV